VRVTRFPRLRFGFICSKTNTDHLLIRGGNRPTNQVRLRRSTSYGNGPNPSPGTIRVPRCTAGTALFGIVTANMILYSLYLNWPDSAKAGMATHSADRVLDFLELMLIEGKFTQSSLCCSESDSRSCCRARAPKKLCLPVLSEARFLSVSVWRRSCRPCVA
jgi:hypothetical protein